MGGPHELIDRGEVKLRLLGVRKGTDADVREALIDRYGGDRETAVGRKANPGPLHGIARDMWAALAVGVAWIEGARAPAAGRAGSAAVEG